ncbi:uncharacterized protein [Leptinotarsa decemlineata]|uniref:uncharacterized protein n=1 Tax=Leptinotarsa decemlineata TaxID=7539 RepID=UPI003D30CA6B
MQIKNTPVESLKKLYDNIKRNIRKEVAEEKTSIPCTGGGSGITVNDPNKELALSIMNKTSVFALDNSLDPDSNDFNVVEDPEQEEIIIEFDRESENEASEENDVNALNWGDYTKRHLKSPLNPKLVPKSKKPSKPACEVVTPVKKTQQHRWSSRRRPVVSNISYSNLSKKYEELADLKIEINKIELDRVKMEYELNRQSLELEIDIKKAHLNKITKSPSTCPIFNL